MLEPDNAAVLQVEHTGQILVVRALSGEKLLQAIAFVYPQPLGSKHAEITLKLAIAEIRLGLPMGLIRVNLDTCGEKLMIGIGYV
jgi:hypothetical protein